MIRKVMLPILAVLGLMFAVITVVQGSRPPPQGLPDTEPAHSPFSTYVAGAGIVEALSENIQVGTLVGGVVNEVCVKVGDDVTKGQPLWRIDDRELLADLAVKEAAVQTQQAALVQQESMLKAAQARYSRLKQMPRPEEIPPAQARVDADWHSLQDAQDQWDIVKSVHDPHAVSQDDLDRRRHAVDVAKAHLAESQANLALLKAGSWDQDLQIAQSDIDTAQAGIKSSQAQLDAAIAQVDAQKTMISRLTVMAPIDGRVLQVNVHPGEYAATGALDSPLMLLGDVSKLVVRTDIDEEDAWRVPRHATGPRCAVAYLRGNKDIGCDLDFYRIEPYVVPKKSLTGDSTERVDTRVLQVLYTFEPGDKPIYVGQQMDVFIRTPEDSPVASAATQKD